MQYNAEEHQRRSIRLRNYDYAQSGAYFITICIQNKACLFGDIIENRMHLNDAGRVAETVWLTLPTRYPTIALDHFVVMPNHIHSLVLIQPQNAVSGTIPACTATHTSIDSLPARNVALGEIVRAFKAVTTQTLRHQGISHFAWQRNYHEHIVRNNDELLRISTYIDTNPANWSHDSENTLA